MHAKLVSIWSACWNVFVKVMAHGVDLHLHAAVNVTFGTSIATYLITALGLCSCSVS